MSSEENTETPAFGTKRVCEGNGCWNVADVGNNQSPCALYKIIN